MVTVGATTTELDAEANLTFDGSTLGLTGALTATGNISSSMSSTGSFGHIVVGNHTNPADPNSTTLNIRSNGQTSNLGFMEGPTAGILFNYDGSNNKLNIYDSNLSGTRIVTFFRAGGAVDFGGAITGSHYSGSATSTGSFGMVEASTASFGQLEVGGGTFTSASLAAGGSGGVSSYTDLTDVPSGIISGSGQLPSGIISGSSQIASDISGSFNKGFEFDGKISGSVTSTGSFGRVEATVFSGDGSGISNVTAAAAAGTVSSSAQLAANISGSWKDITTGTGSFDIVRFEKGRQLRFGDRLFADEQNSNMNGARAYTNVFAYNGTTLRANVNLWDNIPTAAGLVAGDIIAIQNGDSYSGAYVGRYLLTADPTNSSGYGTNWWDMTVENIDSYASNPITADDEGPNYSFTRMFYVDLPEFTENSGVSGSATSTGSFGLLQGDGSGLSNVSATLPSGLISSSAQLAADISGSFTSGDFSFTNVSGSATSTGSFGKIDGVNKAGGTLLRLGETQVAAGNNVGDAGARYVFNVDNHAPYVGIGVLQQNNTPHTISILNATYRSDGNFNYGFTLNQDNDGKAFVYAAGNRVFDIETDGTITLRSSGIVMNDGDTGNISGSATSTGSFGKGKFSSGIIEGKGSSNTYIELTGAGYPNDNFRVYIAGQKSLHIDNNAGGVMMGYAASATGDSVAIGFGASSAASTVAIGRGISSSAGEIRIGESGNTDAYLAQGNATLHVAGVVVSGSTSITGDLTVTGSISGSASSTGSFGRVDGVDSIRTSKLRLSKDTTEASDTTLSIENFGGGNKLTIVNGATSLIYEGRAGQSVAGLYFNVTSTAMLGNLASSATVPAFKFNGDTDTGLGRADSDQLSLITGGTEAFRVTSTLISGSAVSTGSFGRVFSTGVVSASAFIGDGSGITGLTSAAISSYTNSGNNRIVTSVDSGTVNSEANLTFDGSTLDVTGDIVVSGDLTINGTTTTLAATNLEIADAFGFFATGSAGANVDAGIIVQSGSYVDSGSAIYHDISSERWSVAKGVGSSEVSVSNTQWQGFVATVYTASASPVGSSAKYGVGEIHIDDDGEIYIYS